MDTGEEQQRSNNNNNRSSSAAAEVRPVARPAETAVFAARVPEERVFDGTENTKRLVEHAVSALAVLVILGVASRLFGKICEVARVFLRAALGPHDCRCRSRASTGEPSSPRTRIIIVRDSSSRPCCACASSSSSS